MTMQKIDEVTLVIQKEREHGASKISEALDELVRILNGTKFIIKRMTIEEV